MDWVGCKTGTTLGRRQSGLLVQLEVEYTDGIARFMSERRIVEGEAVSHYSIRKSTTAKVMMRVWSRPGWDQPSFSDAQLGRGCGRRRAAGSAGGAEFSAHPRQRDLLSQRQLQIRRLAPTFSISARTWSAGRGCTCPARLERKFKSASAKSSSRTGNSTPRTCARQRPLIPTLCAGREAKPSNLTSLSTVSVTSNSRAIRERRPLTRSKALSSIRMRLSPSSSKPANQTVNQLWSNILWGQRGNFLSVPTDCPQRDERLGWMGDAEVFWRTASFNANLAAFSHKFTTDIRDAQSSAGAFADVSPRVGPTTDSVAGWADAGVIIPWSALSAISGHAHAAKKTGQRWKSGWSTSPARIPIILWLKERGNDYGDWLAIGSTTSKDLIATAYWAYDASLMMRMAQVLDRPADEQKYREVFEKVSAAFNQEYVKPDGTVGTGSQTSDVLALHMNLLPQKVANRSSRKSWSRTSKLTTGI